ncbi:conserved hypothetical protein [Ricinus communis]|uniref:Uncharacterized protein n=1 Tax=Ricinus communis TaxID=3988 RepID=B9T421_RICCO|nr:conserved hypothetical protein [Ricinus communis]
MFVRLVCKFYTWRVGRGASGHQSTTFIPSPPTTIHPLPPIAHTAPPPPIPPYLPVGAVLALLGKTQKNFKEKIDMKRIMWKSFLRKLRISTLMNLSAYGRKQ